MDYTDLNGTGGEVQVFTDYRRRVSAAWAARREILARPRRHTATRRQAAIDLAARRRDSRLEPAGPKSMICTDLSTDQPDLRA